MVGAGVTLHEAIVAADALAKEGVNIRVVDPFTLKPIDKDLLIKSAKATGGRLLTVEDHYPEGRRDGGLPPVVGVVGFIILMVREGVWRGVWLVVVIGSPVSVSQVVLAKLWLVLWVRRAGLPSRSWL